jgi:hypothetical protein
VKTGAIDRDEGARGPRAVRVELARNGILTGPGFTGDENVGVRAREAPHLIDQGAHRATVRDEPLRGHVARGLCPLNQY